MIIKFRELSKINQLTTEILMYNANVVKILSLVTSACRILL